MKLKTVVLIIVVLLIAFIAIGVGGFVFVVKTLNKEIAKIEVREIKPLENNFGNPVILSVSQNIIFADGLSVILKEINDSRCKPDVVCVWAGELSAKFTATGGGIEKDSQEFTLGTATKNITTINGYTFILQTAAETTVTIIVSKQSQEVKCATDEKVCPDGSTVGRVAPNCAFAACPSPSTGACYIGGCSGQICSDKKDVVSTCEYKEEYACYKTATCSRQSNGQCGWTQTTELKACLAEHQ